MLFWPIECNNYITVKWRLNSTFAECVKREKNPHISCINVSAWMCEACWQHFCLLLLPANHLWRQQRQQQHRAGRYPLLEVSPMSPIILMDDAPMVSPPPLLLLSWLPSFSSSACVTFIRPLSTCMYTLGLLCNGKFDCKESISWHLSCSGEIPFWSHHLMLASSFFTNDFAFASWVAVA